MADRKTEKRCDPIYSRQQYGHHKRIGESLNPDFLRSATRSYFGSRFEFYETDWHGTIHRNTAFQWFRGHDQTNETLRIGIQDTTTSEVMTEVPENKEHPIAAEATAESGSPDLREKVVQALKTVYDPEIPVDIYELGLIYEISVYPVNNVFILMTLTSPSCPSAEAIPKETEQKIKTIAGVNDVKIELTFDPPYSQEMMSEAAKLQLGFMQFCYVTLKTYKL